MGINFNIRKRDLSKYSNKDVFFMLNYKENKDNFSNKSSIDIISDFLVYKWFLKIKNHGLDGVKKYHIMNDFYNKKTVLITDKGERVDILLIDGKTNFYIKDFNKSILDEENSNFLSCMKSSSKKMATEFCLGVAFDCYCLVTKKSLLKGISKVKWLNRDFIANGLLDALNEMGGMKKVPIKLQNGKFKEGLIPKNRMIHTSFSCPRVACFDWNKTFPLEEKMLIQGGNSGLVISGKESYTTAFVEAFPEYIRDGEEYFSAFIRGEGSSYYEAEKACYDKLLRAKMCENHEWVDNRNLKTCKKCKVSK